MIASLSQLRKRRSALKALSSAGIHYAFRDEDRSGISRLITLPRFACDILTSRVDSILLNREADNSTLATLSPLRDTRLLGVYGGKIDDRGLAAIDHWDRLAIFSAHDLHISSDGLANAAWTNTVNIFSLLNCPVDDGVWQHLRKNDQLIELGLGNTRVRNISHLAEHPHIQSLCLNSIPVQLDEIASFPCASNLSELYINATSLDDASLPSLRQMPNVVDLALGDTPISDDAFQHIAELVHLEELVVNDTDVTDHGISLLERLPQLRFLCITNTGVSTSVIKILSRFAKLETVFADASLLEHLSTHERAALPFDAVGIDAEE